MLFKIAVFFFTKDTCDSNLCSNKIRNIQVVANIGLQLFVWKILQSLNNNTSIHSVFCVLTTLNLTLPHPVFILRTSGVSVK